jgi:hypothetical protein
MGNLARLILSRKLENRPDVGEGRIWPHQGDERDLFLKLLMKTDKQGVDEGPIGDRVAELPKFTADRLDALAEDGDRGVALRGGAKLDVKRVDTRIRVVLEQLLERITEFSGGGIIIGDEVEELGRNPSINPLDDREIVFDPTRIRGLRYGRRSDRDEHGIDAANGRSCGRRDLM